MIGNSLLYLKIFLFINTQKLLNSINLLHLTVGMQKKVDDYVENITNNLNFIDLFAGIGGIRTGFEKHFGNCVRSEEHTSEVKSHSELVCRLLLDKQI